jgi:hypothetical protein
VLNALTKLFARQLRQVWSEVKLVVRGDSGFCRSRVVRGQEQTNKARTTHHGSADLEQLDLVAVQACFSSVPYSAPADAG